MWMRGVPIAEVRQCLQAAGSAGIALGARELEEQHLAGGRISSCTTALIRAQELGVHVTWSTVCMFDLANHDPVAIIESAAQGTLSQETKQLLDTVNCTSSDINRCPDGPSRIDRGETRNAFEEAMEAAPTPEELRECRRIKTICLRCDHASTRFWFFCPKCHRFDSVLPYRPVAVGACHVLILWALFGCLMAVMVYRGRPEAILWIALPGVGVTLIYLWRMFQELVLREDSRLEVYRIWRQIKNGSSGCRVGAEKVSD